MEREKFNRKKVETFASFYRQHILNYTIKNSVLYFESFQVKATVLAKLFRSKGNLK